MRTISDLEKKIIDRICEGHTHISTILTDHIPNLIICIDKRVPSFELRLKDADSEKINEKAFFQTEQIIYIIKFLMYLENEGYALTGYFSHGRSVNPKIGLPSILKDYEKNINDYTHWAFTDERMIDFMFKYTDLTIFPTHQLKSFQKSKYRTKEDVRHIQILRVTYFAICISLFLGIFGVYQNFNTENPTKTQINKVIEKLNLIEKEQKYFPTNKQVDSLINVTVKSDILNKSNEKNYK